MHLPSFTTTVVVAFCVLMLAGIACLSSGSADSDDKATISFSGGHDTDPKDGGRPVVLIAAALGVKPEVFREAFSGVTPARDGKPSKELAQRNKAALMKVLKPHGVSNDRLDEVSDYYRYQPQRGQLWKCTPARAHALLEAGKVKRIIVTDPGSGYSTPPAATLPGRDEPRLKVTIAFSQDLRKNGSVRSIDID